MRYKLCGCVDIVEVEFVDCLLPSCRQSICHPNDCHGILCPCTISLGPRVLLVKPPVDRQCEKCKKKQSLAPLPTTKAYRYRHKRDTRDRHPARQACEPVRELPKPKPAKTRTKDVDRPKTKSSRRSPGEPNRVPAATASPVVVQTPGTVPSMRPSLLPPRPRNPHPPSSTSSSATSGTPPPASKITPIPNHVSPPVHAIPSPVFSVPIIEKPSKTPSRKTSSTLSSLGSTISKTGTTRYPLPEIPWPSTAAQTPAGTSPASATYFVPLDPLGTPHPRHDVLDSPHSSESSSSRWRTATASSADSQPGSELDSSVGSKNQSRTSRTWSWKRTGLSRPAHASQPLEPLPLPSTPAPPPSERRSSFTSNSTRPRMMAPPFISQPSSPRTSSSAQSSPMPQSPTPKRPKLGWTASTLMAVLPKVPSRPFSQSSRDVSPVLVEHPITPPPPGLPDDLKPRPRRSFLRNPWR
ncbi:hypothetical protein RhiJN_15705 [Ceratobasidium sp. AG-Ba]|nr:hypothetical protein RhiJN_15705 [Ceratobasidium sp. AG-Ba]